MATNIIMPALGMAQEKGKLLDWLKKEGDQVIKGELLMQIETDKVTLELESPATGTLANISAHAGQEVPVGEVIGVILEPGEVGSLAATPAPRSGVTSTPPTQTRIDATPVATRMAAENHVDLSLIRPKGSRIEKSDVLAYLAARSDAIHPPTASGTVLASPKARRAASERGIDLKAVAGSGDGGAVLYRDLASPETAAPALSGTSPQLEGLSTTWRLMAERTTRSWTSAPHFYLMREVNAARFVSWKKNLEKRTRDKITFTDLLVRLIGVALQEHPRANASWSDGGIRQSSRINIGIAVATAEGLIVPVIENADQLSVTEISRRRQDLVARAEAGKLRPADVMDPTFTISNLGMYGIDVFNAIINPPQAATLAVGKIADRVVPVDGQPAVQPMMILSLSCDHRVLDGARGAAFLQTLSELIEEPTQLLD